MLSSRFGQVGVLCHEHDVTEQGQRGPGTDGRAVHCCDHRDVECQQRPEEGSASIEGGPTQVGVLLHLLDETEVALRR